MWQEIIVGLIGLGVLLFVGWKIYKNIKNPPSNNKCSGCSGCALKDLKKP